MKKRLIKINLFLILFINISWIYADTCNTYINQEEIENLSTLCKIWGFLKYYHPSVNEDSVGKNWDKELLNSIPYASSLHSKAEVELYYCNWIAKLGKVQSPKEKFIIDSSHVKMYPDFNWMLDTSKISTLLKYRLTEIKNAERNGDSYFVELAENVGNPIFKNENLHSNHSPVPPKDIRLLTLFRYWNIINYYYPYKYITPKDWDTILPTYIPVFFNANSVLKYRLAILSLLNEIRDSHSTIKNYDYVSYQIMGGMYCAPIQLRFIENQLVVTDFVFTKDTYVTDLQVGDIITEINNKKVEDIVNEKLHYYPGSNVPTQLRNICNDLLRTNDTLIKIKYIRNNFAQFTFIIGKPSKIFKESLVKKDVQDSVLTIYNSKIPCIKHDLLKNKDIEMIWGKIKDSKALIIDLRNYPKDFVLYNFSKHLVPKKTPFAAFTKGSTMAPGLFIFNDTATVGASTNIDYYKGKVILLVDETTQSSSEFHAMAYRTAPNSVIIGSTTAGADGNVSLIPLPGGITAHMSGIGIYYPNGEETQQVGIIPNIKVSPSIKGIAEGRDEVLEKALEIANKEY